MATEASSAPIERDVASPAAMENKADAPVAKTVNGHADPEKEHGASSPGKSPAVNGVSDTSSSAAKESTKSSLNQQAFTTNSTITGSPSPKATNQTATQDTKMAMDEDVTANGDGPRPEEASSSKEVVEEEAVSKDGATEKTAESAPMDVDVSVEGPDVSSGAEQVDDTQNTSAMSDAPIATSADSSQAADLSKLDIQATQEDASSPTRGADADVPMIDSPAPQAKMTREREDDNVEEPAAKRAKTDDGNEEIVADSLVVATSSSVPVSTQATSDAISKAVPDDAPITIFQNRKVREVLGNVKKTKNGHNFRRPVGELWPMLWNDYNAKILTPIDISAMEAKLREGSYKNYGQLKADLLLLYKNAIEFNGEAHDVTRAAAHVREYVLSRLPPIINEVEPVRPEKGKAVPTRHTEPRAATHPPRRQSQSHAGASVTSPKTKNEPSALPTPSSATSPAFAIPPSGIPQIRRDSTRDDSDRPKRPIHPPKNRDPDYGNKGSRKKLEPEQQFFEHVLNQMKKPQHFQLLQWFLNPVDPVALQIPEYFKVIKKPMDIETMVGKNLHGEYKTVKDLEKDMRQIVINSEVFNGSEHDVTAVARQAETLFKSFTAEKNQWMENKFGSKPLRGPAASPERTDTDSEEESEADDDDDESEAIRTLQKRIEEEEAKIRALMKSKNPDIFTLEISQTVLSALQRKLLEERAKLSGVKKTKSKKKGGATKSKAKPSGAAAGGGNKKSSQKDNTKKPSGTSKKSSATKKRTIGTLEKNVIAEGINELDGPTLVKAVEIIKKDTGQNENDDGEMELDIDSLSDDALAKLYDLINKAHPHIRQTLSQKEEFRNPMTPDSNDVPKNSKAKKNKPMNKIEQERKIEQLRELKAQLQRTGSASQEPVAGENEDQAPADSSEESDSEEE